MRILHFLLVMICLLVGCTETSNTATVDEDAEEVQVDEDVSATSCSFEDGTHAADVKYYNPVTRHAAEYELEVEIQDCKVVQINFPKGGWLDEDHITETQIDENGDATLKDDKGRVWKIRLQDK